MKFRRTWIVMASLALALVAYAQDTSSIAAGAEFNFTLKGEVTSATSHVLTIQPHPLLGFPIIRISCVLMAGEASISIQDRRNEYSFPESAEVTLNCRVSQRSRVALVARDFVPVVGLAFQHGQNDWAYELTKEAASMLREEDYQLLAHTFRDPEKYDYLRKEMSTEFPGLADDQAFSNMMLSDQNVINMLATLKTFRTEGG